jgi:hypothetical protein
LVTVIWSTPHVAAYDPVFNHAHNGYLASLRDGGLIGLGLLLTLLAMAVYPKGDDPGAVRYHGYKP